MEPSDRGWIKGWRHEFLCGPWRTKNYWHSRSYARLWTIDVWADCVSDSKERWSLSIDFFFSLAMETTGSARWVGESKRIRASHDEWRIDLKKGLFDLFSTCKRTRTTRRSVNQDALNLTDIEACESIAIVSFSTSQAFETHVEKENAWNLNLNLDFFDNQKKVFNISGILIFP